MRKFISILLSCMLVVAMCCIGISASAVDNNKAIIHVYNFCGDTIDDAKSDTHPELAEKGVEGETYTFDVGDVVNIYINYSSDVEDAAATALGDLYINQVSIDPTDAEAFSKNTDGSLNTLKFTDKYFTSDERDTPAESGIYYSGIGNGSMCNPDMVFDKDDSNWTESQDSSIDRCKYLIVYPYSGGYSVATPKRVFTMTVVVTEASESYLYTALESVTKPDIYDDADAAEIGDDIIVSTTMKKVGHIDIEQPTEPETEISTETPTEAPTEISTEAPTEAPTELPTELPTEAPTEAPTEVLTETPTLPPIYTVVGSSSLCGSNMDPADIRNDMTEVSDGLFQKVYTNVAAGDIEFKVVENHSWDTAFDLDGANCVDTVIYDDATVVVNFDSTTGVVTWTIDYPEVIPTEIPTAEVTEIITEITTEAPTETPTAEVTEIITEIVTEAPTETPTIIHTYTVAGSAALCVSNWDPADLNNDMTEISDGIFQKVYTGVNAGGIEFKVAEDHSWDNSFGPEGNALGSANCIADVLYDNAIVTINFDSATGFVTWKVDYPEVPTDEPTEAPTKVPTDEPTEAPTEVPTDEPTEAPTEVPTDEPTEAPTEVPTDVATDKPTTSTTGVVTTPTSATNATNATSSSMVTTTTQTSQTSTSKVATGDASSVAMLLGVLMIAAGTVVSVRRKITSK